MSQTEPRNCTLRLAARSQSEECPRERCPFWEPGGTVLAGGCAIEHLGVELDTPGLAAFLLDTRERLEQARDSAEAAALRRECTDRIGLGF